MEREKSCGAVVYHKEKEGLLFLILKSKRNDHWMLPHGHQEKGESEEETAHREILEECGLEIKLIPGFRETATYPLGPEREKEVVYFLGESEADCVTPQPEEVADFVWMPYEHSKERITHDDGKRALGKAHAFLTSLPIS